MNQAEVAPAPIDSRTEPGRLDYLVFHYGGIGDLCLLSDLIASLKSASSASVGLICRSAVAGVTNLYPVKPDQVLGFDFDPAGWSSPDASLRRALWPIIEQLTRIEVDTLFCADMNLSWLGWLAAAVLRPRRAIAASPRPRPDEMISPLLKSYGLPEPTLEGPPLPPVIQERERYAAMLAHAGGIPAVRLPWTVGRSSLMEARTWLSAAGLVQNRYLLAVPFGVARNTTKAWPAERFENVLAVATERHGLGVVLAGDTPRRELLESLANRLSQRSIHVATFVGSSGDLGLLAGLVAGASAYVGIDTGPAHLAQAYGTPAAIVFGGGSARYYTPWGRGAVGVMQPIPCSGCMWDCAFGSPLCLDHVSSEELGKALDMALTEPNAPPTLHLLSPLPEPVQAIVAGASQRYRTAREAIRGLVHKLGLLENENIELRKRVTAGSHQGSSSGSGLSAFKPGVTANALANTEGIWTDGWCAARCELTLSGGRRQLLALEGSVPLIEPYFRSKLVVRVDGRGVGVLDVAPGAIAASWPIPSSEGPRLISLEFSGAQALPSPDTRHASMVIRQIAIRDDAR